VEDHEAARLTGSAVALKVSCSFSRLVGGNALHRSSIHVLYISRQSDCASRGDGSLVWRTYTVDAPKKTV